MGKGSSDPNEVYFAAFFAVVRSIVILYVAFNATFIKVLSPYPRPLQQNPHNFEKHQNSEMGRSQAIDRFEYNCTILHCTVALMSRGMENRRIEMVDQLVFIC